MNHVSMKNGRDMAENIQLDITWDGPITGVAENRLSLTFFGPALEKLLAAAKRISSNIVTNAAEPSETGRLAKMAHGIDVQIANLVKGSTGVAALLTFDAPVSFQGDLFFSLPEKAGIELVDSIEAESKGEYRNSCVRQFLYALPKALTSQHYVLHANGRPIRDISLGQVTLPEGMLELPYLQEVAGMITGVGFDPGRNEVRLKAEDAMQMTTLAVPQQVNRALSLRAEKVRALVLQTGVGAKLLTLSGSESRRPTYSDEEYIFGKWAQAFQELA
jgi:hypothetical protein